MTRRSQAVPWTSAGRVTEQLRSADDVVRETGWVFNNATGSRLTIEEFVESGEQEVGAYFSVFGLLGTQIESQTVIEIGCGIGRMTSSLTTRFGEVIGCDLDAGFLERCRETVARFGRVERLRTSQVADGRTLDLPGGCADIVFSYITLQHCSRNDALALSAEAVRTAKVGGKVALNFRTWRPADTLVLPLGAAVRTLYRLPRLGGWLARRRWATRLGWQANRLQPEEVIAVVRDHIGDIEIWRNPQRPRQTAGTTLRTFEGVNRSHWWLIATVTSPSE
jgi:ubiquinone/menaquinone biosynthesis C-methylase UbiE